MSKKKKSEAKIRRRSEKRARKAMQKGLYETWKKTGQNTKSKRVKLRAQRLRKSSIRLSRHRSGPCGNIGCRKCNPIPENLYTPTHLHLH